MRQSNGKRLLMLALASSLVLGACSNSDIERQKLKQESEVGFGVARTVTAYSQSGEKIGEWHGSIDVEYASDSNPNGGVGSERVDLVVFDGEKAIDRIVISGGAIVVVDND